MAKEFKYDVLADLGTIEETETVKTCVKVISFNGGKPKLDIRKWYTTNNTMGKGVSISLDPDVIDKLKEALEGIEDDYDLPNESIDM